MTNSGVSLQVMNLKKYWGPTQVLMGIDFQIASGGFLTLLGPSGCGKSTALRLICGLDEVSDGEILIDGKDVSRLTADKRNIGMVFQNYALFPHMTVAENIAYGLKVRKVAKQTRKASVDRVADMMALDALLDRKPSQLSGGQQQRVALARVLVSDRPLVLMDEPLSNLDAKLRTEIRGEIKALNKKLGITIVYVTHDQSEALSMSDTVVLMNAGRAEQIGTPQELHDQPASVFAAGFIGTPPMNLLNASDVAMQQELVTQAKAPLSDLLIGVRPERLRLAGQGSDLSISCRVASVEYEGSVFLVHLVSPSGSQFILAYAGEDVPIQGAEITVGWDRSATHLFSSTTGNRVPFNA